MRFAFTDNQIAFRDAVRDLLANECPPEVVRAAWPDGTDDHGARKGEGARADTARVAKVWSDLADMGVLGIAVDEDRGGLGLAELDWVLLAEETGYAALPHPFVETACVVAPLLSAVGDPHGVLDELVDGRRRAGVVPLTSSLVAWGDDVTYLVDLEHHPAAGEEWVARRITGGVAMGDDSEHRRHLADAMDAGRHMVALGAWEAGDGLGSAGDAERAGAAAGGRRKGVGGHRRTCLGSRGWVWAGAVCRGAGWRETEDVRRRPVPPYPSASSSAP